MAVDTEPDVQALAYAGGRFFVHRHAVRAGRRELTVAALEDDVDPVERVVLGGRAGREGVPRVGVEHGGCHGKSPFSRVRGRRTAYRSVVPRWKSVSIRSDAVPVALAPPGAPVGAVDADIEVDEAGSERGRHAGA